MTVIPLFIQTRRLILRPWREEDLPAYATLNADPRVMEYFPSTLSKEESDRQARSIIKHIQENGWGFWVVEAPGVADFIGFIGLEKVDFSAPFTPAVEIGWRLAFDYWGHGYAAEGARAALQYGFEKLQLNQIVSFTAIGNKPSRRVMEHIGMRRSAADDFDHPKLAPDSPVRRHVLYRLSREEWEWSFASANIKIGSIRLHTECFGNSADPACLLIAGAMAPARFWTDAFCREMAKKRFFVIRYDHRDIGESSAVWAKKPYVLADLANDAIGILDAYGIQRAYLAGHSMGGHICQRLAIDHPERILSMAIIASGPIGASTETDRPLTAEEQKILEKTWAIFLSRKEEDAIEGYLSVWRYLNGNIPLNEEMARAYTHDLLKRSAHPIRAGNPHELVMRNLHIEKQRGILKKIHVPTLVIHGDQDHLALPRDGQAVAHAIPHAHLKIIPGMGHMMFNRELERQIAHLLAQQFR
jgi:RimJ/RimL family protein N-acetyltransferase/pimeloyl-ACP methyl ester carboxylesterase